MPKNNDAYKRRRDRRAAKFGAEKAQDDNMFDNKIDSNDERAAKFDDDRTDKAAKFDSFANETKAEKLDSFADERAEKLNSFASDERAAKFDDSIISIDADKNVDDDNHVDESEFDVLQSASYKASIDGVSDCNVQTVLQLVSATSNNHYDTFDTSNNGDGLKSAMNATHINTSPVVFKIEDGTQQYFSSQNGVDLQSEVSELKNTIASMQQNFVLLQSENKSQAELIDELKDKIGLLESELKETDEWVLRISKSL